MKHGLFRIRPALQSVSILFEVDMVFEAAKVIIPLFGGKPVSILFEVDMVFEANLPGAGNGSGSGFQSYLRWIWYLKDMLDPAIAETN